MKRVFNLLLMVMVALCVGACASSEQKKHVEKIEGSSFNVDAPTTVLYDNNEPVAAAYMNINDLLNKCGFTENQRKLIAAAVISDIEEPDVREYVQSVIANLDNSGIKFSEPVYATFNMDFKSDIEEPSFEFIMVAEVSNANTLDMLAEKSELALDTKDGVRSIDISNDYSCTTIGYDSNHFVVAVSSEDVANELFYNTIKSADVNLSAFMGRDVALYINFEKGMKMYEQNLYRSIKKQRQIADNSHNIYEVEDAEWMIDDLNNQLEQLAVIKENVGDDIKAIFGLRFDDGRIVLDVHCEGGSDKYADMWKVVDGDNLKYVPGSAIGVVNIGVAGEAVVNVVKGFMTPDAESALANYMDISVNELRPMMTIAYDAVSSINGDLTIALNYLNVREDYVYEYGEYVETETTDLELLAMANVVNNYIIDNVSLIPIFKQTASGDGYYFEYDYDGVINVGQLDNTLYLGINASCKKPIGNSIASKWAGEFDDSIGYLAVDFQNLLSMPMVKKYVNELCFDEDYETAQNIKSTLGLFDSVWFNLRNNKSAEFVVTMSNKETNALAQLVNHFLKMAI